MSANTSTFDLRTATLDVLAFATRQDDNLRQRIAPIAAHLIGADDSALEATTLFNVVRGQYLQAKTKGKTAVASVSTAWNRTATALRQAFARDDLVLSFPDLRTGKGKTGNTATVETKQEASDRRKLDKAEQSELDAQALAAAQSEAQQAELNSLRALTPAELVSAIESQIRAWSDDADNQAAVIMALAVKFGIGAETETGNADMVAAN
jgi:hypothetical protein